MAPEFGNTGNRQRGTVDPNEDQALLVAKHFWNYLIGTGSRFVFHSQSYLLGLRKVY